MKKNSKKIIFVFIALIFILFVSNTRVNATDGIMQGAEDFLDSGNKSILNIGSIKVTSNTIFNAFTIVGTAAVLIVGVILGIKFVVGSVEEKSKIKEVLTPYIISSIVIFGAFGIWSLAVNLLQEVF